MPTTKKTERSQVFADLLGNLSLNSDIGQQGDSRIDLALIDFNPKQPRRYHPPEAHADLVKTIKKHDVIQSITVRPIGDRFEVIAGERRVRAARDAGKTRIPAVIIEADDATAFEIATLENMAREDLNPVEETLAVLQLLETKLNEDRERVTWMLRQIDSEERGRSTASISLRERSTIDGVFEAIGRYTAQSFVNNRLPILKYPQDVLEAVMYQGLPFRTAKPISTIADLGQRAALIKRTLNEKLSKEEVSLEVQRLKSRAQTPRDTQIDDRLSALRQRARKAPPEKLVKLVKLLDQLEKLLEEN